MKFGLSNDKSLEHFWSFVYFHGELNSHFDAVQDPWDVPGDLVSSDTDLETVEEGIREIEVAGKPATLYLGGYDAYGCRNGVCGNQRFKSGFIVWNDDDPKRHNEGKERMKRGY